MTVGKYNLKEKKIARRIIDLHIMIKYHKHRILKAFDERKGLIQQLGDKWNGEDRYKDLENDIKEVK